MDAAVQRDVDALRVALKADDEQAAIVIAMSLLARALSDLHRIANAMSADAAKV